MDDVSTSSIYVVVFVGGFARVIAGHVRPDADLLWRLAQRAVAGAGAGALPSGALALLVACLNGRPWSRVMQRLLVEQYFCSDRLRAWRMAMAGRWISALASS